MRLLSTLVIAGLCAATSACGGDDGQAPGSASGGSDSGGNNSGGSSSGGSDSGGSDSGGSDAGGTGSGEAGAGGNAEAGAGGSGTAGSGTGGSGTGGGGNTGTDQCWSTLVPGSNTLVTDLNVNHTFVKCDHTLSLQVTGGTVCAADDGSGGLYYRVESLNLADVPPMACTALANVGLSNVSLVTGGNGTEVVIDKLGGTMVGNQPVAINGDVSGTALGSPIDEPLSDFTGMLPEGDVAFDNGDTTVSYDDDQTTLGTAAPEVSGQVITITLKGLTGSLTFDP